MLLDVFRGRVRSGIAGSSHLLAEDVEPRMCWEPHIFNLRMRHLTTSTHVMRGGIGSRCVMTTAQDRECSSAENHAVHNDAPRHCDKKTFLNIPTCYSETCTIMTNPHEMNKHGYTITPDDDTLRFVSLSRIYNIATRGDVWC